MFKNRSVKTISFFICFLFCLYFAYELFHQDVVKPPLVNQSFERSKLSQESKKEKIELKHKDQVVNQLAGDLTLSSHQQKIMQMMSRNNYSIDALIPTAFTAAVSRQEFAEKGLIASKLHTVIEHASTEGFERKDHQGLIVLEGLGHQIRLDVLSSRVVSAHVTFADQASSADWMLIAPLLVGHSIESAFMPSELQAQRIGKWILPDERVVMYQMQTKAHPEQKDEVILVSAEIKLVPFQ